MNEDLLRNPVSETLTPTQETGFLIIIGCMNEDLLRNPVSDGDRIP
jgi:hypothetical protein